MSLSLSGDGVVTGLDSAASSDLGTVLNGKASYVSGTWTPDFVGSTSNPTVTWTWRYGVYVKIGDAVHIQCDVRWSALSGGGGTLNITGLPFTAASNNGRYVLSAQTFGNAFTGSYLVGEIAEATTAIGFSGIDNAGTATAQTIANLKTSGTAYIRVTGFYLV